MPSQKAKVAVVTGANSGRGLETAAAAASAAAGATAVMACRNPVKAAEALEQVQSRTARADVSLMVLDLACIASARAFAGSFAARHARLDVLINTPGVMAVPLRNTVDGFEMQIGNALCGDRGRPAGRWLHRPGRVPPDPRLSQEGRLPSLRPRSRRCSAAVDPVRADQRCKMPSDAVTIFDHLIAGRIPASFVWQDAVCVAFLDISPMSRGHVLVVPRQSVATLDELDAPTRAHLFETAVRIAKAQREALGSRAQHVLVNDGKDASQSVPHVHIHVIPRYTGDRYTTVGRIIWHIATLGVVRKENAALRRRLDADARAIAAVLNG